MTTSRAIDTATRMAAANQAVAAAALLETAGRQGDADAAFTLAVWALGGATIARDLPRARRALRRAAELNHRDAAMMEVALTANGTGAPTDWPAAVDLLTQAQAIEPAASQQLTLLAAMDLDEQGYQRVRPALEQLSTMPNVARVTALLTPAECAHIAHAAHPLLEPAVVADPATGRMIRHSVRTSLGAVIGPTREDLVIAALNRRIASVSGLPCTHGEPLAVLAYQPGQEYKPHFDGLPQPGNQRARTVLVYLNDGFGGGETLFIANGLKVAPRGGDAIIFDNVTATGEIDPRSQHAGLPVTHGTKWLATRWIRQRPYDPWNPR